jgi:hypothetical protein
MDAESASGPALQKIDIAIARLRLLLADLSAREASLDAQRRTAREQQRKLVQFSLYGDATLDSVLSMLADVDERQQSCEALGRSLHAIRQRAENELESLQLTKGIEAARVQLAQLQATPGPLTPETQSEIARLRALINEGSERAARTIEARFQQK